MKNMLKDTFILVAITLLSGLILSAVYEVTKEPIAVQEEKARQEAFVAVFKEAESFETVELTDTDTVLKNAGITGVTINEVVEALGSDKAVLGYCITVTSHEGYGGDIKLTVGICNDGSLNGISILEISETPGLGMKAEEVLKPQFEGKQTKRLEVTKSGEPLETQIDAISGATITSNAVTNAVNGSLELFHTVLLGGEGNE